MFDWLQNLNVFLLIVIFFPLKDYKVGKNCNVIWMTWLKYFHLELINRDINLCLFCSHQGEWTISKVFSLLEEITDFCVSVLCFGTLSCKECRSGSWTKTHFLNVENSLRKIRSPPCCCWNIRKHLSYCTIQKVILAFIHAVPLGWYLKQCFFSALWHGRN